MVGSRAEPRPCFTPAIDATPRNGHDSRRLATAGTFPSEPRGNRPRTAAGSGPAGRLRAADAHAAAGLGALRVRRPALQPAAPRRTAPAGRQPGRRRGRGLGPLRRLRRLRRLHPRLADRVPPPAAQGRHAVGDRRLPQHLPHRRHPAGPRLLGPERRDLAQGQPDAELPRPPLHQRARDADLGRAPAATSATASTTRR